MSTNTAIFSLIKPAINDPTDQDLWGGYLNTDLDSIDSLLATKCQTITEDYDITIADANTLLRVDATAGQITLQLPSATNGLQVSLKKIDASANAVVISGSIDGASSISLSAENEATILVADGTEWNTLILQGSVPTTTYISTSGTYTTPDGCKSVKIRMVGGGGGGSGNDGLGLAGTAGGDTTFGTFSAKGGSGGGAGGISPGAGGTGGTGTAYRQQGGAGGSGTGYGIKGGDSLMGAGASAAATAASSGANANANSGGGGGGAPSASFTIASGAGGGSGEYVEFTIPAPATSYTCIIGAGGAGSAVAGNNAGGTGGTGVIIVTENY